MSGRNDNQASILPPLQEILSRLKNVKYIGSGRHMAECPAHADREASLSISQGDDGRVLLKCFAGCSTEDIVKLIGMKMKDLFPKQGEGRSKSPPRNAAHLHKAGKHTDTKKDSLCNADCTPKAQAYGGITLPQYAEAKKLPLNFLRSLGLSDISYLDLPAVRIPYYDASGNESGAVRIRKRLEKTEREDDRFAWKKGSKLCLYGLNRKYTEQYRILCEGESNCHTLWFHGFPAVGIPGADNWKEDRDAPYFDDVEIAYVVVEPDQGGEAVKRWLSKSRIRARARLISLDGYKDPSGLHLSDTQHFKERFQEAMERAALWTDVESIQNEKIKQEAWEQCKALAESGNILNRFMADLSCLGVVGEERISQILFLSLISRFLDRPVSAIVKGPSSGGKSFLVESVLKFFPPSAYYALTSMSEHSLAYSNESLKNRFLVLYEAAGLNSDLASYMLRSLLSEGCVRYETVEKTKDGLKPRLIEREGPTGAVITTTSIRLHPENETRLLSMTVTDTQEQTARVMLALAKDVDGNADFTQWHSLQTWLEHADHRVSIPFAADLAKAIPPIAVRLRRDFTQVLNLIRAHAILNQVQRARGEDGSIIASIQDYSVVRDLVIDFISEGVGATVPKGTRETVAAVEKIIQGECQHATVAQVAKVLTLDRSAASRRIGTATEKGYLGNIGEKKSGSAKKIVIGDPLPDEIEVLPSPEKLGVCRCAVVQEGANIPSPPPVYEVRDDGQLTY